MKILVYVVLAVVLFCVGQAVRSGIAAKPKPLEDKLSFLESCGFRLAAPFTVENLLESWSREDYEGDQWSTVLLGLGMTEEEPPWRPHCVNLWLLDTECISGPGDYAAVVDKMVRISEGSLSVADVADHVDLEREEAWFSFNTDGREIKVVARVDGDWIDPSVFGPFVELLEDSDPDKVYVYYDLGGQSCLIGCISQSEFRTSKKNKVGFIELK